MLMNYVSLGEGVPTRMHFTDSYYVEREVWDENFGRMKKVRSLVFWVDELGGEPAARTFSVLSKKLADLFDPYLVNNRFTEFDFVVTKKGEGFATEYTVQAIPVD